MEPDDTYWRLVGPIWKKVSIYYGGDVFLRGYAEISDKQKIVLSTHWAQSEIGNGGLRQFFWNSTGVLAPEAVQGFRALGMVRIASVIEEAMMFFESPYPRDRNKGSKPSKTVKKKMTQIGTRSGICLIAGL